MENSNPDEREEEVIRQIPVSQYLIAHSKHNGGIKSFFHSNLFSALVVWSLSQAIIVIGIIVSFYIKTNQLTEWKTKTDETLKRMDDFGTIHGHYADERQDATLNANEPRLKKVEEDSRHWPVIESEHRRLTEDVERLKNGKK